MPDKKVNRGTQCNKYDKYGVPIPEYLEEGLLTGPLSLELEGIEGEAEADY